MKYIGTPGAVSRSPFATRERLVAYQERASPPPARAAMREHAAAASSSREEWSVGLASKAGAVEIFVKTLFKAVVGWKLLLFASLFIQTGAVRLLKCFRESL